MLPSWAVVLAALLYIGALFAVASYGDRKSAPRVGKHGRPNIYALSLAVYCTSWTFFGSVGMAAKSGFDFITIYIGPALLVSLGYPLMHRLVRLAKAEKITSIADFLSSRYGKNQGVAVVATFIAVVGIIPYIALQLKAVSGSVTIILEDPHFGPSLVPPVPIFGDIALLVAIAMAAFAVLFGTRHIDATEHQEGLMLAIAMESVVKLVAFLLVGFYVTFWMFDGPADLLDRAAASPAGAAMLAHEPSGGTWITMTLLSLFAAVLLPRQFHVAVVENNSTRELRRAVWLFPTYLMIINLFVVPIALAGLITFDGGVDGDSFVLRLPISSDNIPISFFAFIGGLSAATAMVIVAAVALSIMISNEFVMPVLLRRQLPEDSPQDMGRVLLNIRRSAIFVILLLAYAYYRTAANNAALASIGLLSFAAIAQFAPSFLGGLIWRHATARGAIAGMVAGFAVWAYTLLLPNFIAAGLLPAGILEHGPFGIGLLRPVALFSLDFDPLTHGVFWSLSANILAFVGFSLARAPRPSERLQANIFVPADFSPTPSLRLFRTSVTVDDLATTVSHYLGEERTARAFASHARSRNITLDPHREADPHLIRHSEQLLASAIGAASSRLVLSLLFKRRDAATKGALRLLDDATVAIQYNRDLLQTALDQVRQGIAVFDRELRLVCWNRQFRELLELPADFGQVGTSLSTILHYNADRGALGAGDPETLVEERIERFVKRMEPFQERLHSNDTVLEVGTAPMPDGGIVMTYADITDQVASANALERARATLEQRVRERTEELTRLNRELARAKAAAEAANIGKTRFIAAAGHDILQPLNAARLYTTSLVERNIGGEERQLIANIDASLEAVEEIIGALLDISRLDAGALKPEMSVFRLDDILRQLRIEFAPMARDKRLDFRVVSSTVSVRSDRRLLRRLLQNLVSNAIKYTSSGRVLVGCRRKQGRVRIDVFDTGPGIPHDQQGTIFEEFRRLEAGAKTARGLGLGLSIVERMARVLDHRLELVSVPGDLPGHGSRFSLEIATAQGSADQPETAKDRLLPTTRLTGLAVLCIDNECRILEGMAALLEGWGCRVVTAESLRTALAELDRTGFVPDVALVDYHLDDDTGVNAVRRLRQRQGETLPAVLITADRSPAVRAEARACNIAVLNKPLKPAALRAILAQWLVQRPAAE